MDARCSRRQTDCSTGSSRKSNAFSKNVGLRLPDTTGDARSHDEAMNNTAHNKRLRILRRVFDARHYSTMELESDERRLVACLEISTISRYSRQNVAAALAAVRRELARRTVRTPNQH